MVPFARFQAAVNTDRKERETREVLSKLAKALVGNQAARVMREYDSRIADSGMKDPGAAFMSCIPDNPLYAELYVDTGAPISMITLLRGDPTTSAFRRVLGYMARAYNEGKESVVLFKVKHLGFWVAYNTADPASLAIPRIVIPATAKGISAITAMPIYSYIELWQRRVG